VYIEIFDAMFFSIQQVVEFYSPKMMLKSILLVVIPLVKERFWWNISKAH